MNAESFFKKNHIPIADSGHHHCHQGWIQTHCPFCTDGRHGWHLGFNIERAYFNCWRCGKHSNWDVLTALLHTDDRYAIWQAAQILHNYKIPYSAPDPVVRKKHVRPPAGTGVMRKQHCLYLRDRGFDPHQLTQEWGLQGTTYTSGIWSWRIIIPIHNEAGHIVAYQGRAINETAKPKYRVTDDAKCTEDPRALLYGMHRIPKDSVVIVEGVADVWRLGPGAIATFGIDWRLEQANLLRQYNNRYILFDPDDKAQGQAERLARWLSYYPGKTEIISDLPTDPGDLSPPVASHLMHELGF